MTKEEQYKDTLEKIRAAIRARFPEPYLACGPDENLACWIWRQCDAALAVYSSTGKAFIFDETGEVDWDKLAKEFGFDKENETRG